MGHQFPVNERGADMWEAIKSSHDFGGNFILDIGCGRGDLIEHAVLDGGAAFALGVDKNYDTLMTTRARLVARVPMSSWDLFEVDVDKPDWARKVMEFYDRQFVDVVFMTSVLPYLHNWYNILLDIRSISGTAFIEAQYFGDGPGLMLTKDDDDMRTLLKQIGWQRVEIVGKTYTGRPANPYRTIWKAYG